MPRDRVLDLVGKLAPAAEREAAERLKSERGVRRFEDSAIDVVLSCARFDEGSDWPLCSHVYNAKIPRSSRLIIQRWGRASRPKGRIAGYPEQWRDAQVLRFYHSASKCTPDVGGDSGAVLDELLRRAADPLRRGQSRGVGGSARAIAALCQAKSLARLRAERDTDCWRLWLDTPDGQPDPRPWAEILAAGDNARVVRAERVAFLDWANPNPDGKPARRPWPQAQWPDLREAPGPRELREAA